MEQTFNDLLRERARKEQGLLGFALWMFLETSAAAKKEGATVIMVKRAVLVRIALLTVLILLVPLVAMQFTDEVVWDPFDFAVMGTILFGFGLTYELIARNARSAPYRIAVGIAVAAAFLLVWVNLAVGIIGKPGGANVMYIGVLAVGLIGAVIARFRPHGMARASFAMALAQMLIPVIVLVIAKPQIDMKPTGVVGVFGLNAFFAMLFVGSALLFRRAERLRSDEEPRV